MNQDPADHTLEQTERLNETLADLQFIEPCIYRIHGENNVMQKDINEIVLRLKQAYPRERISEFSFIGARFWTAANSRVFKMKTGEQQEGKTTPLKLKCLCSLCSYDSKNGTTYALFWSSVLCQLLKNTEDSEAGKAIDRAVYWFIYNEIGSTLLFNRRPKNFRDGLQLANLELMLNLERSIHMLSSPVAISLSYKLGTSYAPNFIHAFEQLKDLCVRKLKLYTRNFDSPESRQLEQDLYAWLYNSSLKGRSGRSRTSPFEKNTNMNQTLTLDEVLSCLEIFDRICATQWVDYAKKFFLYLRNYYR